MSKLAKAASGAKVFWATAVEPSSVATTDKGIGSAYFWNRALTFRLPRVVIVQIWQLGLLNYVLQAGVVAYYIWIFANPIQWALMEVPNLDSVNAWAQVSTDRWQTQTSSIGAAYPYCDTSAYDFVYDAEFNYTNSHCEPLNTFEVFTKLPRTLSVATVYLDIVEEGWACSDAQSASRTAACLADGGSMSTLFGTQCLCTTKRTTYPVGTDDMSINFNHMVSSSSEFGSLSGSASNGADDLGATVVEYANGEKATFAAGDTISLTLAEWLRAAGGITLDAKNMDVSPDLADSTHYPYFRTTGVTIVVNIDYTNVDSGKAQPEWGLHPKIRATVEPKADASWAGLAVRAPIYDKLPTGPAGAQDFKKLLRYSQGVLFKFSGKGTIYRTDALALVTLLTNFVVLLGLSGTITGLVARYAWPTRKMIRNKSEEKLAIGTRLAEIAIKAASHAVTYGGLEKTGDGKVTVSDLISIFEKAGAPLSQDQAMAISMLIISRLNDDDAGDSAALREMDYVEYLNGLEPGMLHFDEFKVQATAFAHKRGYAKASQVVPEPA